MDMFDVYRRHHKKVEGKIILIVLDGLGGLPRVAGGPTELESARKPNLDALAAEAECGLLDNVDLGLTPGSGAAHLGFFGYDPLVYDIGRGLLGALGIGFPIQPGDLAARINFCTAHPDSRIVLDRRAGRLPDDKNIELVALLNQRLRIPGCEVFVRTEKEHRACVVFRGADLYDAIGDTDPQTVWTDPPHDVAARDARSEKAAGLVAEFVRQAERILKEHYRDVEDRLRGPRPEVEQFIGEHHPGNALLLRGFARYEKLPHLGEIFGLRCAAIATYPMYKGVAALVGMEVLEAGETIQSEFDCLERHFDQYDLFFLHIKKTDSYGEDGNWEGKVHIIEEADQQIPRARALGPAVLCVTGDHSTPCVLKAHSWHPVPVLVWSKWGRPDDVRTFGERACGRGSLGRQRGIRLMPVLVAHAQGFEKYGA